MANLVEKVKGDWNGRRLYEEDGFQFWAKPGYEANVVKSSGKKEYKSYIPAESSSTDNSNNRCGF
jgi:hypothetical protein